MSKRLTDAEFERQYRAANEQSWNASAVEALYRPELGLVWVKLSNECVFAFPPHLVEGLATASEDVIREVEILGGGCGLRWESLDIHLSIAGLLMGSFGTRAWMQELGRQGGRSSSDAKAEAARKNGRKGGRPRKSEGQPKRIEIDPEPTPSGLLWDSSEAPVAHSVGAAVFSDGDSPTASGGWRTPRSSRTPSSHTPARAA